MLLAILWRMGDQSAADAEDEDVDATGRGPPTSNRLLSLRVAASQHYSTGPLLTRHYALTRGGTALASCTVTVRTKF